MDDPYAALGKRIQHLRQKSGVTQEQLAEKADLSLKHLGELERDVGIRPVQLAVLQLHSA